MYSIVLMMTLSGGASAPTAAEERAYAPTARVGSHLVQSLDKKCSKCCGCYGCYGCYGCCGCWGCHCCCGGVIYMAPATKPKTDGGKKKEEETRDPNRATILVQLPADAKLLFDDSPTASTSATRVFVTPVLEQGKEFSYTLKAEAVRGGQPVSVTKKITVSAGKRTDVTFDIPTTSVALK